VTSSTLAAPGGGSFDAVLFDLDGTLVDTAPDMVRVLQEQQQDHGIEPVDYAFGRSNVSNGAIGLLGIAFPDLDIRIGDDLHVEYLERYAARVCVDSMLFDGLGDLLEALEAADRPWGVVTNKPAHLTTPLLEGLGLLDRSACTVSGDTLPVRKPDPAPLLHAAAMVPIDPGRTLYVGDAARDIEAGRRAGMTTIGVRYGYITADDSPAAWGADHLVDTAPELAQLVRKAVNL
jgi:phosphoglycolate phosphatase